MTNTEINEQVARKLGWYEEMLPSYISPWTGKECGLKPTLRNPKTGNSDTIPPYSTSIAAAWEILASLVDAGATVAVDNDDWDEGDWHCWIYRGPEDHSDGYGATAPMAICLAFLNLK